MNLEYRLPNGRKVKFLDDQTTYLGNQLEPEFGGERCFGVLANMDFIMISSIVWAESGCSTAIDSAVSKILSFCVELLHAHNATANIMSE